MPILYGEKELNKYRCAGVRSFKCPPTAETSC